MKDAQQTQTTPEAPDAAGLSFYVTNVTGTRSFEATGVDPTLPADVVSQAMAVELSLPQNVPWTLRRNDSAEYVDGQSPIGQQIEPGTRTTLTPKSHLG